MEVDLGTATKLTKEETEELYAIREPTTEQLLEMAKHCGFPATSAEGKVFLTDMQNMEFEPLERLDQSHILLGTVIAEGDCRLCYDDGVREYFIYQYKSDGPPIAHQYTLQDTAFEAAMNLWFPES